MESSSILCLGALRPLRRPWQWRAGVRAVITCSVGSQNKCGLNTGPTATTIARQSGYGDLLEHTWTTSRCLPIAPFLVFIFIPKRNLRFHEISATFGGLEGYSFSMAYFTGSSGRTLIDTSPACVALHYPFLLRLLWHVRCEHERVSL